MKIGDTVFVQGKYKAIVVEIYAGQVKVIEKESICGNCHYCNFGNGLTYEKSLIKTKKRKDGIR